MIEVTRLGKVKCYNCSGQGWVSIYHDDTEDCSDCCGTGFVTVEVKLPLNEMMVAIESEFSWPPSASEIFSILEIHKRWSK